MSLRANRYSERRSLIDRLDMTQKTPQIKCGVFLVWLSLHLNFCINAGRQGEILQGINRLRRSIRDDD